MGEKEKKKYNKRKRKQKIEERDLVSNEDPFYSS